MYILIKDDYKIVSTTITLRGLLERNFDYKLFTYTNGIYALSYKIDGHSYETAGYLKTDWGKKQLLRNKRVVRENLTETLTKHNYVIMKAKLIIGEE